MENRHLEEVRESLEQITHHLEWARLGLLRATFYLQEAAAELNGKGKGKDKGKNKGEEQVKGKGKDKGKNKGEDNGKGKGKGYGKSGSSSELIVSRGLGSHDKNYPRTRCKVVPVSLALLPYPAAG